jgi:hypothetical protein
MREIARSGERGMQRRKMATIKIAFTGGLIARLHQSKNPFPSPLGNIIRDGFHHRSGREPSPLAPLPMGGGSLMGK